MKLLRSMCVCAMLALPAMAATRVRIDFPFKMQGAAMPAGTYLVDTSSRPGLVSLTGDDGRRLWFTASVNGTASRPRLVFKEKDGVRELREIHTNTTSVRVNP